MPCAELRVTGLSCVAVGIMSRTNACVVVELMVHIILVDVGALHIVNVIVAEIVEVPIDG